MASDPAYAKAYYDKQHKAPQEQFSRKCHDCGKPTNDYRCKACWAKRRAQSPDAEDAEDTHSAPGFFLRDDITDLL